MGARTGVSLKLLQFFWRGITFGCAIVVLGIYAYFLATMHTHKVTTPTWVRAVEGLAGSAALYSLIGLLLLWCLAGRSLASLVAVVLDVCFVVGFLYVAIENRGGASRTCKGSSIRTPFGTGASDTTIASTRHDGSIIRLPSFRTACKLETACLAVSVIAIVALILAALTEMLLARNHRREKQYGAVNPGNGFTDGTGKRRLGPFGRRRPQQPQQPLADENALPLHPDPNGELAEKPPATYGNSQKY
ncbi:hypothetical protein CMQ_3596 [Grosmannia clavigera kw1407]|uniref:MARVEL domain-containing protein n=1 Tax=Grosmannia clavigera (strain kw1407 / UAMH 11150) TaxID=655863 RepID=F0X8V3_GROCL|nr:uncharacterized protein CMQ_3596 [Grosmannia clavigera kw1407]EFX05527.1 hypothetical protein CMQ_3596 [Grosmannia clavigera kw1407]